IGINSIPNASYQDLYYSLTTELFAKMMEMLFGRKKTPAELLRIHQRTIQKAQREMERERSKLEISEKKLIADIKKSAKANQMAACKIMAKDLVRTRRYIQKFQAMKTQLQAVNLQIQDNPLTLKLPPVFKERKVLISRISKGCHKLCLKLLELFAIALEVTESEGGKHWFEKRHDYGLKSGDCLRVIHYPAVEKVAEKDIRAGVHSDYGSLTVLFQKDVGGLEVLPPNSTEWISAPVIPDCVLINIGDCLEFWTRGLYKSIKHRVVFGEDNLNLDRYSIAYFFHAGRDVGLDPIPSKFVPNDGNEKLGNGEKSLTAGQYLQNKLDLSYKNVIIG
ncbi:14818_t:CDS:2, partial [Acaulospora colombiana]